MRIIVHADMDAFYAAVEQLDDPSLAGRPVIVGGTSDRGVVSTASYEARRFGVGSAMPMVEARRRCPQAVFVEPRVERYAEVSSVIMDVFRSYSPLVEPLSLDEAFIDMTGAERLFGDPRAMGRRIKRDVREATGGLTVSVGVASTKYVAKVASDFRKPDGLTVVEPDRVLEFLHPMDVSRLWGAGKRTRGTLAAMGLETIGDVARTPVDVLRRRLGSLGDQLHDLARGVDPRPVVPHREARSIGAEYTLESDVTGFAGVHPHLRRAAEKVARRLRGRSLLAGGVRVKLKTASFRLSTRQGPLSPPSDTFRAIEGAATALLDDFDLDRPYRLVGVAAFHLEPSGEGAQVPLFADPEDRRHRELDRRLDEVRSRFGERSVRRGADEE
jgi:DNA polymerase-4